MQSCTPAASEENNVECKLSTSSRCSENSSSYWDEDNLKASQKIMILGSIEESEFSAVKCGDRTFNVIYRRMLSTTACSHPTDGCAQQSNEHHFMHIVDRALKT